MQEIEQFIPAGGCQGCRGCCRFGQLGGPWSPHFLDIEEEAAGRVRLVPSGKAGENAFVCSCLDRKTGLCGIYGQRPLECRLYPFLLHRQKDVIFLAVDDRCPAVSARQDSPDFAAYVARLESLFSSAEWQEVLVRNRERIPSYLEVRMLAKVAP
jgi:Fe-S-cluster containining protein